MSEASRDSLQAPIERIALRPMPQQTGTGPDDDWTGIGDREERKRIQNRLNQRARRCRNRREQTFPLLYESMANEESVNSHSTVRTDSGMSLVSGRDQSRGRPSHMDLTMQVPITPERSMDLEQVEKINILDPDSQWTKKAVRYLEALIYQNLGSPRTDLLLTLMQFNFNKALMNNIEVLGLSSEELYDDALSLFNVMGPWEVDTQASLESLPLGLQPTPLQRLVPHHPWLDLLPMPQMRDNLLRAGEDYFDDELLCHDLRGYPGGPNKRPGVLIWKDPWEASGWEVTEEFLPSWGWAIQGCQDLLRSTNYWRAQRGEKPLFRV